MTDLDVDQLLKTGSSIEVVALTGTNFGADSERGARRPHRHDYHEMIWTRRGSGRHLIDGEVSLVRPGSITLIGRGQVHVFESARELHGRIVRFGAEPLTADLTSPLDPAWIANSRAVQTIEVPADQATRLEAAIDLLAGETQRPRDARTINVERHLLSALLLWVERWHEATQSERHEADDPDLLLYRRFSDVLERGYTQHHSAVHYADELRIPQSALSRALVNMTGRTTKELITDRRMLEAARLLRFSQLTIGEVAFRAGYSDQFYFSRAFKREFDEAPTAYRERMRGRASEA